MEWNRSSVKVLDPSFLGCKMMQVVGTMLRLESFIGECLIGCCASEVLPLLPKGRKEAISDVDRAANLPRACLVDAGVP